jgi:LAO/AO transport system kinase
MMIAGAGDELQGIKRGILEVADVVVINKADGDNVKRAEIAARDLASAIHLVRGSSAWQPPVCTMSATERRGLDEVWAHVLGHREFLEGRGELAAVRHAQSVRWMWSMIEDGLRAELHVNVAVRALLADLEPDVRAGVTPATVAARRVLDAFRRERGD